jgi:hypothetical protein
MKDFINIFIESELVAIGFGIEVILWSMGGILLLYFPRILERLVEKLNIEKRMPEGLFLIIGYLIICAWSYGIVVYGLYFIDRFFA